MRVGLWLVVLGALVLRLLWLEADAATTLTWSGAPFTDEGLYSHAARNRVLFGVWRTNEWDNRLVSPLFDAAAYAMYTLFGVGFVQVRLIKELLTKLDAGTTVDAGGLMRNPTSVYTDSDIAEREWRMMFRAFPQMIGLSGDLPDAGSFLTTSDFGTPVLATRGADGVFRAMVNSCRHRGAIVETAATGTASHFSCPFHAWTYASDGSLTGLPKPDHFGDVDRSCLGLQMLPAAEKYGMLWVHPDPAGTLDVDALLGPELADELAHWDLGSLSILGRDDYDIACNWKLAIDTFGETYHFPVLHKNTLNFGFHGNVQCYDTFGRNHRMILCRRAIDDMATQPEDQWDIGVAALPAYWLFPNVQLLPFAGGCFLVRAYPIPGDPGRHVSRISFYGRAGDGEQAGVYGDVRALAQGFASIIRDEDYVMSASQQAAANAAAQPYSLFGRNEPALHHYHRTYRAFLGMDPLPLLTEEEATAAAPALA